MDRREKVFVAGHRGLVGSALVANLMGRGYHNLVLRTHQELDLQNKEATEAFIAQEKPDYVFIAAAKVGGIVANNTFPAEFILSNLAIQTNIINASYLNRVKRLLFLGSSCIYPRLAPQPLREEFLLTGPLEATNRAYAIAKIAGIEMCWAYNREFSTQFVAVMPTNLYGPGDNYHPEHSHVIPAMIRRFHEAKLHNSPVVTVWGTGTPRREFMFSEDMADACIHIMNLPDPLFSTLLGSDEAATGVFMPPAVNIGVGADMSITELAETVRDVVGFRGDIVFDASKPDGTPQKLLDVSRINALGWRRKFEFRQGLIAAYADFLSRHSEASQ
jgi:GDP-L-fucose synthase